MNGKCLFVIQHASTSAPSTRLPRLKGIEITDSEWLDGNSRVLIFRLEESAHCDLFHQLCLDIVSCASNAATEKEAVSRAVARTWRWHHLLRGGGDHRLSPEEQKGLIGELMFIEQHLLPNMRCVDAVNAWHGPLGSPKDFELGRTYVEVKARRGGAAPHVAISSENQLDTSNIDALYLYVVNLDRAPAGVTGGFTLTDIAARIRQAIAISDQGALEMFEGLLSAAGFRWTDDYSDMLWLEGSYHVYRIADGFPCLTAEQLVPGVANVRYSISLVCCQPYLVDNTYFDSVLKGTPNAT